MIKTALITGGTDGIGRGTAYALAREGYRIHLLGRNEVKGQNVLADVERILPGEGHKFYHADLSNTAANLSFLEEYKRENDQLNLLVHSANALTKNVAFNDQGVAVPFYVGAVSRYLLSVELDDMLTASDEGRVMHLGMVTLLPKVIDYDAMETRGVDIAKVSSASFLGSGMMVRFFGEEGQVRAPHVLQDPGVVNTQQVRAAPWYFRLMFKFMNPISPEKEGEIISRQLTEQTDFRGGTFYKRAELVDMPSVMDNQREWERFKIYAERIIAGQGRVEKHMP